MLMYVYIQHSRVLQLMLTGYYSHDITVAEHCHGDREVSEAECSPGCPCQGWLVQWVRRGSVDVYIPPRSSFSLQSWELPKTPFYQTTRFHPPNHHRNPDNKPLPQIHHPGNNSLKPVQDQVMSKTDILCTWWRTRTNTDTQLHMENFPIHCYIYIEYT